MTNLRISVLISRGTIIHIRVDRPVFRRIIRLGAEYLRLLRELNIQPLLVLRDNIPEICG